MPAHDIETENLAAHVSLCQERYLSLERRFDVLEEKIASITASVQDIHTRLDSQSQTTQDRFQSWHWALSGSLATAVIFLLERVLV